MHSVSDQSAQRDVGSPLTQLQPQSCERVHYHTKDLEEELAKHSNIFYFCPTNHIPLILERKKLEKNWYDTKGKLLK